MTLMQKELNHDFTRGINKDLGTPGARTRHMLFQTHQLFIVIEDKNKQIKTNPTLRNRTHQCESR
jgi:hypothetical protein